MARIDEHHREQHFINIVSGFEHPVVHRLSARVHAEGRRRFDDFFAVERQVEQHVGVGIVAGEIVGGEEFERARPDRLKAARRIADHQAAHRAEHAGEHALAHLPHPGHRIVHFGERARAEHHVRLALQHRIEDDGERGGVVLTVAVHLHHHVEAAVEREAISGLQRVAVAEVLHQGDHPGAGLPRFGGGRVGAAVVDHQDFLLGAEDFARVFDDTADDPRFVIGRDDEEDPLQPGKSTKGARTCQRSCALTS